MKRLFLDANILFSAALTPGGRSSQLFELSRAGLCGLVTSRYALGEATHNLSLKAEQALVILEHQLLPEVQMVPDPTPERFAQLERWVNLKDVPILAGAVDCEADGLVTGDKRHFGSFYGSEIEGVQILSPQMAVAMLIAEAEVLLNNRDPDET